MAEESENDTVPRDVAARWSPILAKLGWAPISTFFLDNYSRLTPPLRYSEAMFVIHLMRHKWDASAPYPSFGLIAGRMGVSAEAVRSYARKLQKNGYLFRQTQIGETNRFHLDALFRALEKLISKDKSIHIFNPPAQKPPLKKRLKPVSKV